MQGKEKRGLEIDRDPLQQNREWSVQRIAWAVLSALLVAIALGLFGRGGPLSKTTTVSADGMLQIEYDRFMRYHSPDALHVTINKAPSASVRLKMDSQYAKEIQIARITPQPDREVGEDGAITYVFNTQAGAKLEATFHFSPEKYGKLAGWLSIGEGPRHRFGHFIYP